MVVRSLLMRTGVPWRDLPPDCGDWKNTRRSFCRWRDRGVWAMLSDALTDGPDIECLMIDANYIKAHPHRARAEARPLPAQKGVEQQIAFV